MKLPVLLLLFLALSSLLYAQKCLDLSVLSLMSKLEVPGNAAANFALCSTRVNENNQTEIIDYGVYMRDLDTLLHQKSNEFNNAFLMASGSRAGQIPSGQTAADAQQLAAKLKSMTPDQQKEWAMQQASQRMQASSRPVIQDDPVTAQLVIKTRDLASVQLVALNREFAARFREIGNAEDAALNKLAKPDDSKCPGVDKVGLPSCSCVNEVDGKYWQQMVVLEDQYDAQKIALYQSYIVRIKGLVEQVDKNIVELHYGEALKSKDLQEMLFSSQSAAFANAFDITSATIRSIHQDGSKVYLNKANCDKKTYNLSCER
ncbi:MAG: hypothetical protein Q8918_03690 [Bacteroidota bacterium]|nr:hypothetical protein [Bacteroidota bacterium]MDP4249196.1 hypothetical protein [Bacteroidota bacterium]